MTAEIHRKRVLQLLAPAAAAGALLFALHPVNRLLLRLGLVVCLLLLWPGCVMLARTRGKIRGVCLLLPFFLLIPFLLPGRNLDEARLRALYLKRLDAFEGVPYVWGGESLRGIDCSGLPRRAYRDALLAYGLRYGNGRACRAYLEQWWFDASARALAGGYRNYTVPVEVRGTLRDLDHPRIQPGDMAVTADGIHLLIYRGEGKWTQADPGLNKVVTLYAARDSNPWFMQPVEIHRWAFL